MTAVIIPQTSVRQPFPDLVTIPAADNKPAIAILVKCYLATEHWYIVAFDNVGSVVIPAKLIVYSPNLWAAHQALLVSKFARGLACVVSGNADTSRALWGQCTIEIVALPTTPETPDLN